MWQLIKNPKNHWLSKIGIAILLLLLHYSLFGQNHSGKSYLETFERTHKSITLDYYYGLKATISKDDISNVGYYKLSNEDNTVLFLLPSTFIEDNTNLFQECMDRDLGSKMYCLMTLFVWGEFLLLDFEFPFKERLTSKEKEEELGLDLLKQGYEYALNDLQEYALDSTNIIERIQMHSQILLYDADFPKHKTLEPVPEVIYAAIEYYLYAWNRLAKSPVAYEQFILKFKIGEKLKDLTRELLPSPVELDVSILNKLLSFYDNAFVFHQENFPSDTPINHPEEVVNALVSGGFGLMGLRRMGYAVLPGKNELMPVRVLAQKDLGDTFAILEYMYKNGLLMKDIFDQKARIVNSKFNALKIKDWNFWIERAKRHRDLESQIDLQFKLAAHYRDEGNPKYAERLLESVCRTYKELGNLVLWAVHKAELISYKIHFERWCEAMGIVHEIKDLLLQIGQLEPWGETVKYEYHILNQIGKPGEAEDWLKRHTIFVDSLNSQMAFLETWAEAFEEPNPVKKRQLLETFVSEKVIMPPYLKLKTKVILANTLKDLGELEEAERLILETKKDRSDWEGLFGYVDHMGGLIEIKYERGEFGAFLESVDEYEEVAKRLRGDNWVTESGFHLATAFFNLQDYDRAERLLAQKLEMGWESIISDSTAINAYRQRDVEKLLFARIKLARGKKFEARNIIEDLSDSPLLNFERGYEPNHEAVFQLAQVETALDEEKNALSRLKKLIAETDPIKHFDFRLKVMLEVAKLQVALDESPGSIIDEFEKMVPHLIEFPELNPTNSLRAVNMDLTLAEYYFKKNNFDSANQRLERALAVAMQIGAVDEQIVIFRRFGELAKAGNDLDAAVLNYNKSIALLKSGSLKITSDIVKVGFRFERNKAIPLLVLTLYELYKKTGRTKYLEEIFFAIEEGKARALTEILMSKEQEVVPANFNLDSLRSVLPANAALLEYYIPEEQMGNMVFRIFIDQTSITVDKLSINPNELNEYITELRNEVTAIHSFNEISFKQKSRKISQLILPKRLFEGKDLHFEKIFIIPSASLHLFPFALFVSNHGKYLDEYENLEIAYLPNASLLMRRQPVFAKTQRSAVFVNPALDRDHNDILSASPMLQNEFKNVVNKWGNCSVAWEQELTKREFLNSIKNFDNVFIFSHARFFPDDPMGSYIKFAAEKHGNGRLSALELLTKNLGNGLWTIAGCSSGAGTIRSGDEVLGLPRALLQAGATMVVISLWDIDTASSLEIMSEFYKNLGQGLSVATSLKAARSKFRNLGKLPFDWAPFVLVGFHEFKK